ncbi:MAG: GAF domain-containing SpoIIE family protein phosphatase [Coriobacteriia bacterium]|nr:GAF domain-containing SpoIIE family protein phosphatase [Coriobacteriia bacterium]
MDELASSHERDLDELVADVEAANRQLEGLLRIVSSTVGRVDVATLIPEVLSALREVMGAQSAIFFVLREDRWCLKHQSGLREPRAIGFSMAADQGFAARVASAGELLWTPDVAATPAHLSNHDDYGIKAMLGIPLFVDGELFGVLECAWSSERLISDAESVMLKVAADRIMAALAGARRFESTSRLRELEAGLAEASALLAVSHDLSQTVPGALRVMAEHLDCDRAAFGLYRDGVFDVAHGHGIDARRIEVPHHPRRDPQTGSQLPVVRLGAHRASAGWLRGSLGLAEALIVPVRVRGEWIGAVVFGREVEGEGFDPAIDEYLNRLSTVLSLAYANARDFDAERQIAATLQESILTLDSDVDGVIFDHCYRSSTLTTRVGGDFYDVFRMHGGLVGIMIGDVSGKGLEAAVFTTLVKHTVRAFAHESSSPSQIVARANSALLAQARMRDFASVLLVVLDPASGAATYCQAGHPPALLVRAGGLVDQTLCASPVVGAFSDMAYEEGSFELGEDDLLVLYTDGVTDARDEAGEFFGEARLMRAAAESGGRDVASAVRAIDSAVQSFSGGRRTDDIAIVCLRRAGSSVR